MWYALSMGLGYDRALDLPFGEILTLVAIEQIKHEGAKLAGESNDDEEIIPDVP